MRILNALCLSGVLLVAGCGPSPEVRAVESKAQSLVTRRASAQEAVATFGRSPIHIVTRAEALHYLDRTDPSDTVHKFWERVSQHPQAHYFPMPGGEILIFFDESGHAVGFYSNIQM